MHDFRITLRVDTPVLLGGADNRDWDESGHLRGGSVRGLLHTFARALWAPALVKSGKKQVDSTRLLDAERRLFGESAGEKSYPPTFRVRDITPREALKNELSDPQEYPIRPNRDSRRQGENGRPDSGHEAEAVGGGKRRTLPNRNNRHGIEPGAIRVIEISPRPSALRPFQVGKETSEAVPLFREMLWVIVWTAFTFGSLGLRQRRGYGSLTIVRAEGVPSITPFSTGPCELPCFNPGSEDPLGSAGFAGADDREAKRKGAASLRAQETVRRVFCGYWIARSFAYRWLREAGIKGPHCFFDDPVRGDPVLRLGSSRMLFAGAARSHGWKAQLSEQMEVCSRLKGPYRSHQEKEYRRMLGGTRGGNIGASPLWIRYFLTEEGLMPFCFYSGREIPKENSVVDRLVTSEALGCGPIMTRLGI